MVVTSSVNLRSWPDLPEQGQANNIVRTLDKGQNVSADEIERLSSRGRAWLYVVGVDKSGASFHGWVAAEFVK